MRSKGRQLVSDDTSAKECSRSEESTWESEEHSLTFAMFSAAQRFSFRKKLLKYFRDEWFIIRI